MLTLSPATRIFLALDPADMRQSFNGLYARVQTVLGQEPTSGHYFLFTNKSRNRLKILFFDGSGLWVFAKRLEKSTFAWPKGEGSSRSLRPEELQPAYSRHRWTAPEELASCVKKRKNF